MLGWLEVWTVGGLDGWMFGWLEAWIVGWWDGRMVGGLDGWMVGRLDARSSTEHFVEFLYSTPRERVASVYFILVFGIVFKVYTKFSIWQVQVK